MIKIKVNIERKKIRVFLIFILVENEEIKVKNQGNQTENQN